MHDQVIFPRLQPTSVVSQQASPPPCETRTKSAREDDGPVLRFGFTCGHLEALAWGAVWRHTPSRGLDVSDRFEAAWGAAVEHVYSAAEPPSPLDLTGAGLAGLDRLRKRGLHERGYLRRNRDGSDPAAQAVPAGSFYRYWTTPAPPTPEDVAVDRTALAQVMARLEPAHAEALLALAEHGDYEAAAAALKLSQTAFNARVRRGRNAPPGRHRRRRAQTSRVPARRHHPRTRWIHRARRAGRAGSVTTDASSAARDLPPFDENAARYSSSCRRTGGTPGGAVREEAGR